MSTGGRELTEGRLLELFAKMSTGVIYHAPDGTITFANPAAERILGGTLEELPPTHPVREDLVQIRTTGQRATELCRQLLAYSGKGRFVVEPINLSEVVDGMCHLLQVSITKNVVLRYHLSPNLPAIEADVTQIRQIILNLIVNASEALADRSGTITVTTGVMDCEERYLKSAYIDDALPAGAYVFLEVADTGCGMDEETVRRVFDPFFTTKFTGRGLGLAATLGIVRGHKGTIKVYSEPKHGATFKILIPASDMDVWSRAEQPATKWQGEGTVLLVDDEETARAVGRRMLARLGFSVLLASDREEAVAIFAGHGPSIALVVLDMTMPRMSGVPAFRELRQLDPKVRVILTSGYNEQDATSRFAGKGLAGFIQKPFQLDAMRNAIRAVLPPRKRHGRDD